MTNVIVFGGSFNPVHIGHVFISCYILSVYKPEKIVIIPVYKHAFGKEFESFEHRYKMCEMAMGWIPNAVISNIEKEIGEVSITARTIKLLKESNPDWNIKFVVGSDSAADLKAGKWQNSELLLQIAEPLIIHRSPSINEFKRSLRLDLDMLPPISSTKIRLSLKKQISSKIAEAYLPYDVSKYIEKHKLYQ